MLDTAAVCTPVPVNPGGFNQKSTLPYGLQLNQLHQAMNDFLDFLGFVNRQLYSKGIPRLECLLMPATFSSLVGEYIVYRIPFYCTQLVKNQHHNGHPDLIPTGIFPQNAVLHTDEGIEVKASKYSSGWQGHNPESVWLLVFRIDCNSPNEKVTQPKPFQFKAVYGAKLDKQDWNFSGRSATSRRTITASVNKSGLEKMKQNWIYRT